MEVARGVGDEAESRIIRSVCSCVTRLILVTWYVVRAAQFPAGTEVLLEYQNDEGKFVRPEPVKKDWRNFEVNDVLDAKVCPAANFERFRQYAYSCSGLAWQVVHV